MCLEAYAAGLIDGEGHIKVSGRTTGAYQLILRVRMLDSKAPRWLLYNLGGTLFDSERTKLGKVVYHWQASGRECQAVLKLILPYLVTKEQEARLALDFPVKTGGAGDRPSVAEREQRSKIAQSFKDLGRRE